MASFDPHTTLRFSIQRALIGEVTPGLLGVTARASNDEIELIAFFDGSVRPDDAARISAVAAEVIADFPAPFTIRESCCAITDPAQMKVLDFWAFKRAPEPATA